MYCTQTWQSRRFQQQCWKSQKMRQTWTFSVTCWMIFVSFGVTLDKSWWIQLSVLISLKAATHYLTSYLVDMAVMSDAAFIFIHTQHKTQGNTFILWGAKDVYSSSNYHLWRGGACATAMVWDLYRFGRISQCQVYVFIDFYTIF